MGDAAERRLSRRYKIRLPIQFRVSEGRTISRWRRGRTCDVSTRGIVFRSGQPVPAHAQVEMIVDWPSKRDDLYPITLRAAGHVVRSEGRKIAVRMTFCRMVIESGAGSPKTIASGSDTFEQ